LIISSQGALKETTAGGQGYGTVYKMTPSGSLTTLYQFDGTHGATPFGPLVQATNGNFDGAAGGGTYGYGVVFKITRLAVRHRWCGSRGVKGDPLLGLHGKGAGDRLSSHLRYSPAVK